MSCAGRGPSCAGWYEYLRRTGLRTPEAVMQRFAAEQLSESDLDD
jgi:hypothetical protein